MSLVNERDVEWTETEHGETHFLRKSLSAAASGDADPGLGCSLYELPPGGKSWPYHFHAANAEALFVRSGTGTLRLGEERLPLAAGDYVPLPASEEGAHRVENDGEESLSYLLVSTMVEPDVTVYPDSGKIGVYAGSPPGGRGERAVSGYFRTADAVSYWEGE